MFKPFLVHTPVTPFKGDHAIDYDTYAKVLEFHLRNGADTLALPAPEGEDMSLTDPEQRRLVEFAIRQVGDRVPVIVHASDAGTTLAVERAVHAEKAGAAAIVSHPPYFWHPKPAMVVDHLVRIGSAVGLPFFIANPPVETAGTSLTTEIVLQLIDCLPNLAGVVDASLDWVFMEETMANGRNIRPEFQLLAGAEFPVSSSAVGGFGLFSPLAGIAPRLVHRLAGLCREEKYIAARPLQEEIAGLHHAVREASSSKLKDGLAGIKAAMAYMGRDCGIPRPPVKPLGQSERLRLEAALATMEFLKEEPQGW